MIEKEFAVHEAVCAQRYTAIEKSFVGGDRRMTRIEYLLYIVIGAVLLGTMKLLLGGQTFIDNSLVIGAILVLVVLLLPKGLLPTLMGWRKQHGQRSVNRAHSNSMRRRGGERRQQRGASEQDKTGHRS